jgi:hypothetical protein
MLTMVNIDSKTKMNLSTAIDGARELAEMLHSINTEQRLYVLTEGNGYSCLGFDVAQQRMERLAAEMGTPVPAAEPGTEAHYLAYSQLHSAAAASEKRFNCELSPQLKGLEGYRVEVIADYDETRRFIVGKSTGWLPCHLEIARRTSYGGGAAERHYKSVRTLYKAR